MSTKEINVNEVKNLVLGLLPSYWYPEIKKVSVIMYDEYIKLDFQYTSLGRVEFKDDKFYAVSGRIYGVGVNKMCDTLEEAITFSVKHSMR